MPFYDENYAIITNEDGTPATHLNSLNAKWCAFQDMNLSQRLKLLTGTFWKWGGSEDVPYTFFWNQAAGLGLLIAGTSATPEPVQFNKTVATLKEVERVWAKLVSIAEAKAYNTEGDLAHHLRIAYEKMTPDDQHSLAFKGEEFVERKLPGAWPPAMRFRNLSEEWEDGITYGLLKQCSHKSAGLLQKFLFVGHQVAYSESKLYVDLLQHLVAKGIVDEELVTAAEEELEDEPAQRDVDEKERACAKVARAVANAIAKVANLPPSLMASPTDEEHASDLLIELHEGADQILDGSSQFMLERVPQNVAAIAPTLHELLKGTADTVAFRGYVIEVAAAFPQNLVKPDPKVLLALSGLKALERQLVNYSAFINAATTKAMHVGERVAHVIDRVQQLDRQKSDARRSARRAQSRHAIAPHPAHPPAFSAVINPAHTRAGGRGVAKRHA